MEKTMVKYWKCSGRGYIVTISSFIVTIRKEKICPVCKGSKKVEFSLD